jgi:hypothetical protein
MNTLDEYAFIMSTEEPHVMKYNDAMKSKGKNSWVKAVQDEHGRMIISGVWTAVDKETLKAANKFVITTWAIKKNLMEAIEQEFMPVDSNSRRNCIMIALLPHLQLLMIQQSE